MSKVICQECYWKGDYKEVKIALNPFDHTENIEGCPSCNSVNSVVSACDEKGCWNQVTCGTPTKSGYRRTCGKHTPITFYENKLP